MTPPTGAEGLYHVTGLRGEGPSELWFGVLGDVFVVASDQETARAVAREETHEVEGAHGSTVVRVDLSGHQRGVAEQLGFDPGPLGELVFWVQASPRHVRGHMDVEVK